MRRRDRPDPAQGEIALGNTIARAGMTSGPPIRRVRPGWFLPIGECDRAHWFDLASRDGVRELRRLCDGVLHRPADLLEPGTWASCKRCRTVIRAQSNGAGR